MAKFGHVYLNTSKKRTTIYTGVTNSTQRRTGEHVFDPKGFAGKYSVKHCVYVERIEGFMNAIRREKQIKKWPRARKIELIESTNPYWECRNHELLGLEGTCPCNTWNPKRKKD